MAATAALMAVARTMVPHPGRAVGLSVLCPLGKTVASLESSPASPPTLTAFRRGVGVGALGWGELEDRSDGSSRNTVRIVELAMGRGTLHPPLFLAKLCHNCKSALE